MRLLLVEDERSLSRAVSRILEKNNYTVDAVYNGMDALSYFDNYEYDAVILDIMLPIMSGFEVLKRMRVKNSITPVLILSARSEVEDKVFALDSGANDYLTKPFDTQELMARLRAMTRSYTVPDSRLVFGNLTLNRANFELSSPTGNFRLANKEFQMLELMMNNPGHLISTERFMEKIWGFNSDTEISVVWVYISYLRKKLLSLQANVKIKATRNAGYMLEIIE